MKARISTKSAATQRAIFLALVCASTLAYMWWFTGMRAANERVTISAIRGGGDVGDHHRESSALKVEKKQSKSMNASQVETPLAVIKPPPCDPIVVTRDAPHGLHETSSSTPPPTSHLALILNKLSPEKTFRTRFGHRFGNAIFEHLFWRLLADQYQKDFVDLEWRNKPALFQNFPTRVPAPPKPGKQIWEKNKYVDTPMYAFNWGIWWKGNRHHIQQFTQMQSFEKQWDIVVHVRLEDIFNFHQNYTLLPLSFYDNVINVLKMEHKIDGNATKILFVGYPVDAVQRDIFNDVVRYFRVRTQSTNIHTQTGGSVDADLRSIMQGSILVCTTSTFWAMVSFLSNVVEEIHVPVWGVNRHFAYFDHLGPNDYIQTLGTPGRAYGYKRVDANDPDNYRIYGYSMPTSIPEGRKATAANYKEIMYDVPPF